MRDPQIEEAKLGEPEISPFVKTRKLLVFVDSEEASLAALRRFANELQFFGDVKCFLSSQKAIDFLKSVARADGKGQAAADLVICSHHMPGVNGLQFLEILTKDFKGSAQG